VPVKVVGIDPGATGALAIFDTVTGLETIQDMPMWHQVVGKTTRPRVDTVQVADLFDVYAMLGVKLICMEAVGGRPRQSASAAFVFGYGVGLLMMAAIQSRIPVETVEPATWKKVMRCPKDEEGIVQRADQMFPEFRAQFRGPKGGVKHDRAEAAMLAKYGADYLLRSIRPDAEWRMTYMNAKTGA
jgi:hypothetical protein